MSLLKKCNRIQSVLNLMICLPVRVVFPLLVVFLSMLACDRSCRHALQLGRVSELIECVVLSTDPDVAIEAANELKCRWGRQLKKIVEDRTPSGFRLLYVLEATLYSKAYLKSPIGRTPPEDPDYPANLALPINVVLDLMGVIGAPALRVIDRRLIGIRIDVDGPFSLKNNEFREHVNSMLEAFEGFRSAISSMLGD